VCCWLWTLCHTIQHRAVMIIFRLTLQTISITRMLSSGGWQSTFKSEVQNLKHNLSRTLEAKRDLVLQSPMTSTVWHTTGFVAHEVDYLLTASLTLMMRPVTSMAQSPASHLSDVINSQFHGLAASLVGPVHFLSLEWQSGIHCPIMCMIQMLTANSLGRI